MNSMKWTGILGLALFAALASAVSLAAQDQTKKHQHHQYHHYQIVDPGTFGGADSSQLYPSPKGDVNNRGAAVGGADTSTPDPTSTCFNGDCYISYGYKWQDGITHKLDALPGFNSSGALGVSNNGHVVGTSENGIDPLTGGRALEAVSWEEDGSIIDLGSLGGNEGVAYSVNNRDEVVGVALNTIPDPYAWFFSIPGATQSHAFRWTKSAGMQDLGTLGGADSTAAWINDRGQISGYSFTDYTVNPVTGLPTTHPFLWENGTMTDLGTLGGSLAGPSFPESFGGLDNRGDVIGSSYLAGDVAQHPFLWTKSGGMQDLGTLPGGESWGFATWVNDAREVVGLSATSDALHAVLWRDGVITDLGTVGSDPNSQANSINSRGQVVGASFASDFTDLHGFLWEDGGSIVDLNTLVPPGSSVFVPNAIGINDRGEIAAKGVLPNGDQHAVLLIPCDRNHPGVEGCDYSMVDAATAAAQSATRSYVPSTTQNLSRPRWSNRYHMRGLPSARKY